MKALGIVRLLGGAGGRRLVLAVGRMAREGLVINLLGAVVITILCVLIPLR